MEKQSELRRGSGHVTKEGEGKGGRRRGRKRVVKISKWLVFAGNGPASSHSALGMVFHPPHCSHLGPLLRFPRHCFYHYCLSLIRSQ